jgi:hypothetical protein
VLHCGYSFRVSEFLVFGRVALDPFSLKLDICMLVERPNGSAIVTDGGFIIDLYGTDGGRGRITTSSFSSPECTPLDDSELAFSGGDVELSVDVVSERGVSDPCSLGTPESARRKHLGVTVEI